MTYREVQRSIGEWTCDECGRARRGENRIESWASVQTDTYRALGGRTARHLDFCSDCMELEKYSWLTETPFYPAPVVSPEQQEGP